MNSQVYITGQPDNSKIQYLLKSDPISALKNIIILCSQGQNTSYLINQVVQVVFNTKNKELLKLFYFYITLIPKTSNGKILAEVLLINNQIRKDIQSVNEYTRGIAMQCAPSFLDLDALSSNFYKPILDNLKHKHSYVRRWAAHALTEFYLKYPKSYYDVPEILYNILLEERDPCTMRQMIAEINRMNGKLIKPQISSVADIVLEIIVDLCDDLDYVLLCVEKVPLYAGMKILKNIDKISNKKNVLNQIIPLMLNCEYKADVVCELIKFDETLLKGYLSNFLEVLVLNDNLLTFPGLIEFLFSIAESSDFDMLCEFMLNVLKTNEGTIKILLIEKLKVLLDNYGIKSTEIKDEIKECVNNEDPAIAYEALNFLSNQKDVLEIIQLNKIKYGKIFRKALNLIKDKIETEEQVINNVEIFEKALDSHQIYTEKVPLLKNMYSENTPFMGASIALFFSYVAKNIQLSHNTKARILALLMKYIKMGEKTSKIDKSTNLTMLMCLQDIANADKNIEKISIGDKKKVKVGSIFDKILFFNEKNLVNKASDPIACEKETKTKQLLTGITDPLLVIATVTILQFEIEISLYIRNQTDSLLQNFSLDLTTSQNLLCFSTIPVIPNLQTSTSHEAIIRFKINECINSFICGTINFNFLDDQNQYSGSIYTLNLSEITLDISNFLVEPEKLNFNANWTNLEWENTYTVKLAKKFPIQKLIKVLKGIIVDEKSLDFIVCNILCATRMGDVVLINVLMYENDNYHMECRIRGKSENVVKSVSGIISECVKECKQ